ncbi:tRNA cyclic N6-threonylcarbamoyladenosine(37) synthase TcdA [Niveibacterium sp. SC-1]|uniref:tRNA cyclic N6-threonylcarbamoyladenosine(37) synthase TcdA n=1 Tax=Niveibacterium sp. SC-1 TaxID=3135646 RepID=UPI00311F00D9
MDTVDSALSGSREAAQAPAHEADLARRFGGLARLYGDEGLARLQAAHVCVIGVGGVGSWAAEALARSAVGAITLIDLDHIAESNANRQLHALDPDWGMAKVEAMSRRILAINPACRVTAIDDFVTPENVAALLQGFDYVIDAIDAVRVKTAIAAHCVAQRMPVVLCGAAGGQLDPARVAVEDLSRTVQDPLLAKVRGNLRRQHGFSRDPKRRFGIQAVFSHEPLRYPEAVACAPGTPGADGPQGLNCAGFGSSVVVTATFGFVAAAQAINTLTQSGRKVAHE